MLPRAHSGTQQEQQLATIDPTSDDEYMLGLMADAGDAGAGSKDLRQQQQVKVRRRCWQ